MKLTINHKLKTLNCKPKRKSTNHKNQARNMIFMIAVPSQQQIL